MEGGTREWEAHSVRHKNTSHDICRGSSLFPAHAILQTTGVMNHDKDSATQPENQNDQPMKRRPNNHAGVAQRPRVGPMANEDQMTNDDPRTMSRAQ